MTKWIIVLVVMISYGCSDKTDGVSKRHDTFNPSVQQHTLHHALDTLCYQIFLDDLRKGTLRYYVAGLYASSSNDTKLYIDTSLSLQIIPSHCIPDSFIASYNALVVHYLLHDKNFDIDRFLHTQYQNHTMPF